MRRFQMFLPKQTLTRLKALSKTTGISIAEHIRRAIDAYLSQHGN